MIIYGYLIKGFVRSLLIVLGFITALVIIIDLIDQSRILNNASFGQVFIYVIMRLPQSLYQFMPLAILIATIMFFLGLARTSELVVLRAAGISGIRLVMLPVIVSALWGSILVAPMNGLITGSRVLAQEYLDNFKERPSQIIQQTNGGIWLREVYNDEVRYLYTNGIRWAEQDFRRVEIFIEKPNEIVRHIIANRAELIDQKWIVHNGREFLTNPFRIQNFDRMELRTTQSFEDIFSAFETPNHISNFNLPSYINNLEADGYEVDNARTYFYSELATPIFYILMTLTGAVFALAPMRGGGTSTRVLMALGSGFFMFGLAKLTESLAKTGGIPAPLGAFTIPIAGSLIILGILLHLEDG